MAIAFRGNRNDVRRVTQRLVDVLSGRNGDANGIRESFLIALGFGALSDIKKAYITKSRGGTDEMGVKWPPLKPETIARRRVGPRDRRDNPDIAARERIRKAEEKRAYARLLASLPPDQARARAKQIAGIRATRITGKTKVQTLGGRSVEILRDTGILFNSLSPGVLSIGPQTTRAPPTGNGAEQQIFDIVANGIIVGTNVPYGDAHQVGNPTRGLPKRQILPDSDAQIPDVWWDRWLTIASRALVLAAEQLYRSPSP